QLLVRLLGAVSQIGPISDLFDTTAPDASPIQAIGQLGDIIHPFLRETPEFDDMLLGRLIVSKENYPFLTLKSAPESAHIYPTVQQLEIIKAAAGGRRTFLSRATGDENWSWQEELAKFLKAEFSYEVLNSTVVDPGSLPFDKLHAGEYFKTVIVKETKGEVFLQKLFADLQNLSTTAIPWLPAQTLVKEMDMCLDVEYSRASNKDFKFDLNVGGKMVFYRVICEQRTNLDHIISISVYENDFKFHPIEHIDTIAKSWKFLWFGGHKVEIHRWFEPRYLTQKDWQTLVDYMMSDFAVRLRFEYREILEAGGIDVHDD
ncbi:hypothetical protein PENTCL1PPCAC_9862, partial [Pristionchus entomophagus]